jgi:hypothetical protein
MMTQLEVAKRTLFDKDALAVADVKMFPGSNRDATPEQVGELINKVVAQLVAGDFEDITNVDDD